MTTRQVIAAALILGLCAAGVVWWLESFNRKLLIAEFRQQLEGLPTYKPDE